MGALAYTQGSDIHFARGQYQPGSAAGDELLGHELAHVVQQSAGRVAAPQGKDLPIMDDAGLEQEADRAGAAAARGKTVALAGMASGRQRKATSTPIQRFESEEHKALGDQATGGAKYNLGAGKGDKFELTHGDLVALSGDVFEPNLLFELAAKPGRQGQAVGTRDEVIWALRDERIWEMRAAEKEGKLPKKYGDDPRFQSGGPWADYKFSDEVKSAVFERYQKLGAKNTIHFAAPRGRDLSGQPEPSREGSAGTSYRSLHETALWEAYQLGKVKGDIGRALAREAAAQHFLTDAFSAGHLRTPVGSIREYWGGKYPLFFHNMLHKIANDTGIELAKEHTVIPNHTAYTKLLAKVNDAAAQLPPITLGDLLAGVFHNIDNEQGVTVEGRVTLKGDWHLDEATTKLVTAAIMAGNEDVRKAYEIGRTESNLNEKERLYSWVRGGTVAPNGQYLAEAKLPKPAADAAGQNWQAASIESLWTQPMFGKGGKTVGEVIAQQIQPGGSIYNQIISLKDQFPPREHIDWVGDVHPQHAYQTGFVDKLLADPKAGLLDVIHWVPHGVGAAAIVEHIKELDTAGGAGPETSNLAGMTTEQRAYHIRPMLEAGPGHEGQALIVRLFETAPAAERKRLYELIEHHPWQGDFVRGLAYLGNRDLLAVKLDSEWLDKLKRLLHD